MTGNPGDQKGSSDWRTSLIFVVTAALFSSGLGFWLTRTDGDWVRVVEYWAVPTWKYWMSISAILALTVIAATAVAHRLGWYTVALDAPALRLSASVLLIFISFSSIPATTWLISPSLPPARTILSYAIAAFFIILGLWCGSGSLNWMLAFLVLLFVIFSGYVGRALAIVVGSEVHSQAVEAITITTGIGLLAGLWVREAGVRPRTHPKTAG